MNYIDREHITEFVRSKPTAIVPAGVCDAFHNYLLGLKWDFARLDWREVEHIVVNADLMSEAEFASRLMQTHLGRHSYVLVMYDPDEPGLICEMTDGLTHLDLLYWGAGGSYRYICGVDRDADGSFHYMFEDFAEYDAISKVVVGRWP